MQPTNIQIIGDELAIKWNDGSESFIPLQNLRRCCPCASCRGEMDILGNVYQIGKGENGKAETLPPSAFQLRKITSVGGYAIQPSWVDGHATGIYSFDCLRRVAEGKDLG